jgi:hypothetical protein
MLLYIIIIMSMNTLLCLVCIDWDSNCIHAQWDGNSKNLFNTLINLSYPFYCMNCNKTAAFTINIRQLWMTKFMTQIITQDWILWSGTFMRDRLEKQTPYLFYWGEKLPSFPWTVNSPNNKFLTLIHEVPLQDVYVRGWCTTSATRFIGPTFFLRP